MGAECYYKNPARSLPSKETYSKHMDAIFANQNQDNEMPATDFNS